MAVLYVNPQRRGAVISRFLYGHFSEHLGRCIYNGFFVGEESTIPNEKGIRQDIVQALRRIRIPVLRWPGGCFADEYHWKDGIGPKEGRKRMVNTHCHSCMVCSSPSLVTFHSFSHWRNRRRFSSACSM